MTCITTIMIDAIMIKNEQLCYHDTCETANFRDIWWLGSLWLMKSEVVNGWEFHALLSSQFQ